MKVAIIGACGKTGSHLVRQALDRGHEVVAVCRDSSAERTSEFTGRDGFTVKTAPVISDAAMLTDALAGCDAVVAVLISVRRLKATELVESLARATAANSVTRLAFTAGEITTVLEDGETFTRRQRLMHALIPPLMQLTPFSVRNMLDASVMIRQQQGWDWTIIRAPSLRDAPAVGYRLSRISEITGKHSLSREDYAACMLDSLENPEHHRRTLAVMSAGD